FRDVLQDKGSRKPDEVARIPIVWSGGTDGVLSPHATVFATVPADSVARTDEPRLTVGVTMSEPILPEEIGRRAMVDKVATGVAGRYGIGHSVMRDALDADGIWAAIRDAGLFLPARPHPGDLQGRLVNVFLKCEASSDGQVRGRRNAMLDDSDVHWHRQIKACVGGVAASVTGDPAVFVSVSAAHQGPDGGGPVAAIVDLGS